MRTHLFVICLALSFFCDSATADQRLVQVIGKSKILFYEDFSRDLTNWWVEGGEDVWIQDGRLHVKAERTKRPKAKTVTVWCKREFPGDIRIDFDAQVISSPIDVNNINFFLCYSDPSGKALYETRQQRKTAAYKLYHRMNGYIFTFLNDVKKKAGAYPDGSYQTRFRMRRCPGFYLMVENYAYHCKQGVTYHITITKRGGRITYAVDGQVYLEGYDSQPLNGGLLGLRTYFTYLWWDNIHVTELRDLKQ